MKDEFATKMPQDETLVSVIYANSDKLLRINLVSMFNCLKLFSSHSSFFTPVGYIVANMRYMCSAVESYVV